MYRVHGMRASGNCHKVGLLLDLLGEPYEWVETDVTKGATRTPAFLAMNPNGKVPVLEIGPGQYLAESNAILHYLAEGTPFLPADRLDHARVLQWMFFEQYSHEPYIATSRYWLHILKEPEKYRARLEECRPRGLAALGVMERHLAAADWFAAGRCTIADIALHAYTHVAHEGGFDLASFPAVRRWLERLSALPGYRPMAA
ncbi:MAG: glutathione S-transferase family protein [Alphaproteobacteria bacterium]|nr:glutathione S-transferase family protein [Alphaproteobacteria bacterium]